jgi:DNA-binding NtrC family response regulator
MVGKIEAAQGGTLFLDEIAEMPLELQPYLLRVLEGGEVHPLGGAPPRTVRFRLIASSNCDLRTEVSAGRFRMDLFYRVAVTSLRIPALRERREDIPALADQFSRDVAARYRVPVRSFTTPEVSAALAAYSWPGNVRELRNVVEAMVLLCDGDVIEPSALPADRATGAEAPRSGDDVTEAAAGLKSFERDAIRSAIRIERGNLTRVARALRIAKSTLYLKMKKYTLQPVVNEVRRRALAD